MGNRATFYPEQPEQQPCQHCKHFGGFFQHHASEYVQCNSPHGSYYFFSDPAKGCRLWEQVSLKEVLDRSLAGLKE